MIGIECSTIIEQARKIVAANGFADKITLIKSKCEDIVSLEALAGIGKVCCVLLCSFGFIAGCAGRLFLSANTVAGT